MKMKECFDLGKVTFTDEELEAPYEEENNMETYKKRMVKEYQELRERRDRLGRMLALYDEGTLEFELSCPVVLLETQLHIMIAYLNVLEQRAEIEKIDLE